MHMAVHKNAVLLSEDVRDTFMCIDRREVYERVTDYDPELGGVV